MNTSWRQRAACLGADPGIFHPANDEEADAAKAICAGCEVRQPCLEEALAAREPEGIWGGTTALERRRILRRRRRTA